MEEADFPMDYQFLVNQLERFLANVINFIFHSLIFQLIYF